MTAGLDLAAVAQTSNRVTLLLGGAPALAVSKSHTGNFWLGESGATYNVVVTNASTAPTSGVVNLTETVPTGLTRISHRPS